VSLRHVSALKGPSSGCRADAFRQGQQNQLPYVKFYFMKSASYLTLQLEESLFEIVIVVRRYEEDEGRREYSYNKTPLASSQQNCTTYTFCCVYSARLLRMDRETVRNM